MKDIKINNVSMETHQVTLRYISGDAHIRLLFMCPTG